MKTRMNRISMIILGPALLLGVTTPLLQAADPLDDWKWVNPLPQGNRMSAVTYGGGRLVAVGNYGAIIHSTNLITMPWAVSRPPTNGDLNAVVFGNGLYVAAGAGGGNSGMILTSTDATEWFKQSWTNTATRAVYGLAYGQGLFVAVTERSGVWTSDDGTNWVRRLLDAGSSSHLNGITFVQGIGFVAVGSAGKVLTSTNGVDWITNTPPTTLSLNALTYGTNGSGEGIFVAVGASGLILTSPDAVNWAARNSGTTVSLKSIAYAPGIGFAAVGSSSGVSWVTTSPDGENWTAGLPAVGNEDWAGITYAPGMFVAVGHYGGTMSSSNGLAATWVSQTTYGWTDYCNAGAWSGNQIVVANLGGSVVTSPDGVNWTYRLTGSAANLRCIAYGAGLFVAGGDAGTILTSANEGTNWTAQSSPVGTTLNGMAFLNDLFVAVGASGVILTSPDGTNWAQQTSGATTTLRGAAYGAGQFVVVGDSGVVRTSPDGTNWAAQTFPDTRNLNGVIYAFGNFVTYGERFRIFTSPDGTNWTARLSGGSSDPTFNSMALGAGRLVAAGGSATIMSSSDGINWTRHVTINAISQRFIAYGANRFIVGGSGGVMIQALAVLPVIGLVRDGATLTLTWSPAEAILQAAPEADGLFTNVPGAATPYTIPGPPGERQFFRVRLP